MADRRPTVPPISLDASCDLEDLTALGRRLVLHVGLRKTGTTTMQHWPLKQIPGAVKAFSALPVQFDPRIEAEVALHFQEDHGRYVSIIANKRRCLQSSGCHNRA